MVYVSQSEWDDCISSRRTRHRNGATDTGYVHGSSLQCFLFCSGVEPSFQLVQCCISEPCTQWWVGDSPVQMQLNDEHCSSSRRHSGVGGAAADSPLIAGRKCGRCCLGSAVVGDEVEIPWVAAARISKSFNFLLILEVDSGEGQQFYVLCNFTCLAGHKLTHQFPGFHLYPLDSPASIATVNFKLIA